MEVINDVETTEIESTTPADVSVDSSPGSELASSEGTTPAAENIAAPVDAAAIPQDAPAYTPDFKVKIKGKELEIDEMFRGLIKDSDSEKKVKEVFEKAYGIEAVKADRASIKQEHESFKTNVMPYLQVYDQFTTLRDQGNLGAAFKVANITDEQVFEYALQKLQMEQNPTLAKTYQAQQEQSVKELELSRKVAMYEQQNQASAEQTFYAEFEQSLDTHAPLVAQVNAKFGSDDFFKEEVIAYGLAQQQKGNSLSPMQATEAVVSKYKQLFPTSQAPSMPQASAPAPRPHTLPNVGNSSASPVKKQVRTMEDLQKASAEAQRVG
jgi:hypothetical protein